jgi:hypothetical protein
LLASNLCPEARVHSRSHPGRDKLEHSEPDPAILSSRFPVPCSLPPAIPVGVEKYIVYIQLIQMDDPLRVMHKGILPLYLINIGSYLLIKEYPVCLKLPLS